MATPPTLILPGGAGYLGRRLARYFADRGFQVTVLSRRPAPDTPSVRHLLWDGRTIAGWAHAVNGATAVINLAGRTVNCRYNAKNKAEIYESRLAPTRAVGQAIAAATDPPKLWVNASSATIYRHALDRPMDEATGEIGDGFSVDVCQQWERTLNDAATPNTRKVALRAAMVFGPGKDGVFEAFARVVRLGLGGTLGRGDQFVSWVHHLDFCRAVEWLVDHDSLAGPVNVSAPNPLPNREFMRTFRQALGKRIGLPATRWMLEVGTFVLRTETELLLKSRRAIPGKLLASGFEFRFPELRAALEDVQKASAASRG